MVLMSRLDDLPDLLLQRHLREQVVMRFSVAASVIVDGLCAAGQRDGCATAPGAGWAAPTAPIAVHASNAANSSAGRLPLMSFPSPL